MSLLIGVSPFSLAHGGNPYLPLGRSDIGLPFFAVKPYLTDGRLMPVEVKVLR